MYHEHKYSIHDAEEYLAMPTYMYNGAYGSQESVEPCAWYDIPCQYRKREEARQAALTQTVTIPEVNKTALYGLLGVMFVGFGVAAYFLLFKEKEE